MTISAKGLAFVEREEGFVSRAYYCPSHVLTIGSGFTNRSASVRALLGTIKPGDTITRQTNAALLAHAFAHEYGPPVDRAMPGAAQHEFDAAYSLSFNCGPASAGWRWAKLWRSGLKAEAAEVWRGTAVTGGGKRLPGLVKRREREARLLTTGDYGALPSAEGRIVVTDEPEVVRAYQAKLRDLGFDPGAIDGAIGPRTRAAVALFQQAHPNLRVDSILGPATKASIDRASNARRRVAQVATAGVSTPTASAGTTKAVGAEPGFLTLALPLLLVLAAAGVLAWRYRDEIEHVLARMGDPAEPGVSRMKVSLPAPGKIAGTAAALGSLAVIVGKPQLAQALSYVTEDNLSALYTVVAAGGGLISLVAGWLPSRKAA